MTSEPIPVFISYSHKDEAYREKLEAHLAILRRSGHIEEWHDRGISPGDEWAERIGWEKFFEKCNIPFTDKSIDDYRLAYDTWRTTTQFKYTSHIK